jgi:glycerophosphoryl diester phosphodiesterase
MLSAKGAGASATAAASRRPRTDGVAVTAAAARKPRPADALTRLIGHRGAAGLAPENTEAGFRKAASLGVRWVEFDVHLSKDGVPVVIHDDAVDRTTDGRGEVAALTLAELRGLDAGSWFDLEFRHQRIPTLDETIALLGELGLGAVVEIKPSPGHEARTAEATVTMLSERWPEHLPAPMVSSFQRTSLARAQEVAPGIARAFTVGALPEDWHREADRLGATAIHADHRRLDRATVTAVGQAGLPLFAYTVNDAERAAELYRWGVAALFSNRPDLLSEAAKTAI